MTTAALKSAYTSAGLWRQGKSFADCLACPLLRRQLERHAAAMITLAQRRGERVPAQQALPL